MTQGNATASSSPTGDESATGDRAGPEPPFLEGSAPAGGSPAPRHLLLGSAYALGIALVLLTALDTLASVWPIRAGDAQWRYGAVGLGAGALLLPAIGIGIIGGIAFFAGHRRTLWLISVVAGLGAVVLLVTSAGFVLDVLQMRSRVRPDQMTAFDLASAMAIVRLVVLSVVAALVAAAGWRASRVPDEPPPPRGQRAPGIVATPRGPTTVIKEIGR